MKKLFLAAVLLVAFTYAAQAQNRSIVFEETKVWQKIVDKAQKEDKLIFVDCYTDWCGPCKILAANTFTMDKVADFFNESFVNAKFEMEKDADGVANKEKWAVSAYPTLLFIDPATGVVVHRMVGAGQPDWLIDGAKVAMDPDANIAAFARRYDAGERSPEFELSYLKMIRTGYMKDEMNRVAGEYLDGMDADRLATPDNWEIIRRASPIRSPTCCASWRPILRSSTPSRGWGARLSTSTFRPS